jgi:hypothetical protein
MGAGHQKDEEFKERTTWEDILDQLVDAVGGWGKNYS